MIISSVSSNTSVKNLLLNPETISVANIAQHGDVGAETIETHDRSKIATQLLAVANIGLKHRDAAIASDQDQDDANDAPCNPLPVASSAGIKYKCASISSEAADDTKTDTKASKDEQQGEKISSDSKTCEHPAAVNDFSSPIFLPIDEFLAELECKTGENSKQLMDRIIKNAYEKGYDVSSDELEIINDICENVTAND
jgi:hypothetical protein